MASCYQVSNHLIGRQLGFHSTVRFRNFMASISFGLFPSSPKPYEIQRMTFPSSQRVRFLQAKSSTGESHIVSDFVSQQEDDQEVPSESLVSVAGGIVALGKFDALHIGHRELAIQASKAGPPFLVSFAGMAEVLGWEPRPSIVAKCDRKRILNSWASYCGGVAPAEYPVEFSSVRHLSPRQFVEKLSKELGVCGVVAGENYRFGYKAAGDTSELVRLCEEYGMTVNIVRSVMDKTQSPAVASSANSKERGQVSSTRVRQALAQGDMKYVTELLGRKHRLKLRLSRQEGSKENNRRISTPKSSLLNLPPKEGLYESCYVLVADDNQLPCKIIIDPTHVHIDLDENSSLTEVILSQGSRVIGIEFDALEGIF